MAEKYTERVKGLSWRYILPNGVKGTQIYGVTEKKLPLAVVAQCTMGSQVDFIHELSKFNGNEAEVEKYILNSNVPLAVKVKALKLNLTGIISPAKSHELAKTLTTKEFSSRAMAAFETKDMAAYDSIVDDFDTSLIVFPEEVETPEQIHGSDGYKFLKGMFDQAITGCQDKVDRDFYAMVGRGASKAELEAFCKVVNEKATIFREQVELQATKYRMKRIQELLDEAELTKDDTTRKKEQIALWKEEYEKLEDQAKKIAVRLETYERATENATATRSRVHGEQLEAAVIRGAAAEDDLTAAKRTNAGVTKGYENWEEWMVEARKELATLSSEEQAAIIQYCVAEGLTPEEIAEAFGGEGTPSKLPEKLIHLLKKGDKTAVKNKEWEAFKARIMEKLGRTSDKPGGEKSFE